MSKKALLMILDGWGLGDQKKDDAHCKDENIASDHKLTFTNR